MKLAFVTGATGFLGGHVVRRLAAEGIAARVLARPGADRSNLSDLAVEFVEGDLGDATAIRAAMQSCDLCVHAAAAYSLPDPVELYRSNVDGTRNVLEAARAGTLSAIVHVSTVGTLGRPGGKGLLREADSYLSQGASEYVRSKFQAERLALQFAAEGLPVVVVNPTAPVGRGDVKPSVTGRRILAVLRGRIPPYARGAINHVPVSDVADGIVKAALRGRPGGRYLLGASRGNLTLSGFIGMVQSSAGIRSGGISVVRILISWLRRRAASSGSGPPTLACDPSRSIQELGLQESSLAQAFSEAVDWFRWRGLV